MNRRNPAPENVGRWHTLTQTDVVDVQIFQQLDILVDDRPRWHEGINGEVPGCPLGDHVGAVEPAGATLHVLELLIVLVDTRNARQVGLDGLQDRQGDCTYGSRDGKEFHI